MIALVLRELRFRWWSALASIIVVALAVATVVFFVQTGRAGEQQTRKIQRDAGLNLVILPEGTNLDRYWTLGHADSTMPADWIDRLEDQDVANRLIPMLRRRVRIGEVEAMLVGLRPEIFKRGQSMKPVFGRLIEPGTIVAGAVIADALGVTEGDTVDVLGASFRIERVLATTGSDEDIRLYAALADVQAALGLEDRINEIQALECHCAEDVADPVATLRAELGALLPGATIVRRDALADARRDQRRLAERVMRFGTPVIVILCGLLIAALAALNVRTRREEIGIFRVIGFHAPRIASVFLVRAAVLGVIGAVLGIALGAIIIATIGARIAPGLTAAVPFVDVVRLLVGAPAFAVVASLVPATIAATEPPAELLRSAT